MTRQIQILKKLGHVSKCWKSMITLITQPSCQHRNHSTKIIAKHRLVSSEHDRGRKSWSCSIPDFTPLTGRAQDVTFCLAFSCKHVESEYIVWEIFKWDMLWLPNSVHPDIYFRKSDPLSCHITLIAWTNFFQLHTWRKTYFHPHTKERLPIFANMIFRPEVFFRLKSFSGFQRYF